MVRANLQGVFPTYKKLKDGSRRTYWYHRASGLRLRGEPGTSEFLVDYAKAEASLVTRQSQDTLIQLTREFIGSAEFEAKLAPSTQREYKRMLTKIEAKFGTMPTSVLEDRRVRRDFLEWRGEVARSSGNREADNRLSALSAMLTWAEANGRLTTNHMRGFTRLHHSDRSDKIWLPEHVNAFMKVAPLEMQQALILALHTGQRQGDLLRLPWSAYDGSSLTLRQGKARRGSILGPQITIPCTSSLRRMLDGMPRRSTLVLTTKTGQSFQKRYFAHLWEVAARDAGIADLHFHDLRGTAVTMLSEAGCNPQQIATITGHKLSTASAILDRYLARTASLAQQAIFNWENSSRTDFVNRLQTGAPAPRASKGKGNV